MSKSRDAFRTISEVAEWLDTPAHVLRFWESKFPQVKPVKRAGGRRYYRPADMTLLGGIKKLLHDDGLTIKGVQKVLSEQGVKAVSAMAQPIDEDTEDATIEASRTKAVEDDDVPARIEEGPEADMAVDAATEEDDAIEDAPFIEAEPPTSSVIPFTGGGLAERPGSAKASAPKTSREEDTPTPASDEAETSGEAQDIVEAPLPEDLVAASDMDDIAPAEPDDLSDRTLDADAAEAMQDAAASTSQGDIDALVAETIGSEAERDQRDQAEEAGSAEDAAPPVMSEATPAPPATDDTDDTPEQPSLFGTTPEFLAKPFSDRESEQKEAEQPEDAIETAAEDEAPAEVSAASEEADTSPSDIADGADTGQDVTLSDGDAAEAVTAESADPAEDSASEPDASLPDVKPHDYVHGPLHHLARIPHLTPEMAARMAPHVAALSAHLDAGA